MRTGSLITKLGKHRGAAPVVAWSKSTSTRAIESACSAAEVALLRALEPHLLSGGVTTHHGHHSHRVGRATAPGAAAAAAAAGQAPATTAEIEKFNLWGRIAAILMINNPQLRPLKVQDNVVPLENSK